MILHHIIVPGHSSTAMQGRVDHCHTLPLLRLVTRPHWYDGIYRMFSHFINSHILNSIRSYWNLKWSMPLTNNYSFLSNILLHPSPPPPSPSPRSPPASPPPTCLYLTSILYQLRTVVVIQDILKFLKIILSLYIRLCKPVYLFLKERECWVI